MKPLVSTRVSIAWPPAPAYEDTDTLVIQGRTGFFLDLRIFISGPRIGEIDWASAGMKSYLPDSTEDNPKAVFDAIVDSRRTSSPSPTEASAPDEGSFVNLPNGDVLETGSMSNPDAAGVIQPYEEVWRRFPTEEGVKVVILISEGGKGFVGRVGRWEVGLRDAVDGDPFLARRRDRAEDGRWTEVYSIGGQQSDLLLPSIPGSIEGKEGDTVELDGQRWVIKENS